MWEARGHDAGHLPHWATAAVYIYLVVLLSKKHGIQTQAILWSIRGTKKMLLISIVIYNSHCRTSEHPAV